MCGILPCMEYVGRLLGHRTDAGIHTGGPRLFPVLAVGRSSPAGEIFMPCALPFRREVRTLEGIRGNFRRKGNKFSENVCTFVHDSFRCNAIGADAPAVDPDDGTVLPTPRGETGRGEAHRVSLQNVCRPLCRLCAVVRIRVPVAGPAESSREEKPLPYNRRRGVRPAFPRRVV